MRIDQYFPSPKKIPTSYPGKRPNFSFLYYDDVIFPVRLIKGKKLESSSVIASKKEINIDDHLSKLKAASIKDRFAIIAYGSNVNPAQLSAKFQREKNPVPLIKGELHDHDIVYSPHISEYGAIITKADRKSVV